MSCINSLTQADIGLSQKVMRNAKTFYHNSTIGASGTCITFVKLSIGTPRRKSEVSLLLLLHKTRPNWSRKVCDLFLIP